MSAQKAEMSALIEPADLGLNACARCDRTFHDGDEYRRGLARGTSGVLLYLVCPACAAEITTDICAGEKFNVMLRERLAEAALAAVPVGGNA